MQSLYERARALRARIVLPEAADPRMQAAARRAQQVGLAEVIFVGAPDVCPDGFAYHDPATDPLRSDLAALLQELRSHKPISDEDASSAVRDPLLFAALMVRAGHADGTLAGAVNATPDVVRAALRGIGVANGVRTISSFFLMVLPPVTTAPARGVIFSDCGMVVDPNAAELAEIAAAAAGSCRQFLGDDARVAMLSFSTYGSARHPSIDKVTEALELLRAAHPGLSVDGELQFDAAFVPEVGTAKAPGSAVAGQANVFVFPSLEAGNIGYKIAQRVGGAVALGPVLQGLARPANDLSRGCTAEDIYDMLAVTAIQSET